MDQKARRAFWRKHPLPYAKALLRSLWMLFCDEMITLWHNVSCKHQCAWPCQKGAFTLLNHLFLKECSHYRKKETIQSIEDSYLPDENAVLEWKLLLNLTPWLTFGFISPSPWVPLPCCIYFVLFLFGFNWEIITARTISHSTAFWINWKTWNSNTVVILNSGNLCRGHWMKKIGTVRGAGLSYLCQLIPRVQIILCSCFTEVKMI